MTSRTHSSLHRFEDLAVAALIFCSYLGLLLSTAGDLGYARDEGFYFHAAGAYEAWFELLLREPSLALQKDVVDRYWSVNREHPALMKSLFALMHAIFYRWLGWFSHEGTAFRFGGMLVSSLAPALIYLWGRRQLARPAALAAALLFVCLPRVFYHSHLAAFDVPVATMWLLAAFVYFRSLERPSFGRWIAAGVCYGLLLNTKHNAWLFPAAVLLHFVVVRGFSLVAELRKGRIQLPPAWLFMAVLGPLVFVLGWPWLWSETFQRFTEYVQFHTGHDYYNMEFLGATYYQPPMPRLYAWVMTLGTVPLVTLLLFLIGVAGSVRHRLERETPGVERNELGGTWSVRFFWLACLLTAYAPWWSTDTPIFGGTKHWIVAYPFLCLLAGVGYQYMWRGITRVFSGHYRWLGDVFSASVIAGPAWMTLHAHPYALSAYTPLVGGASGAATLGLNRTFWGYTTLSVADYIERTAPPGGSVYVHDTALQSFRMLVNEGRLRHDLRGTLAIHDSSVALYHHEPHMQRVEQQIWVEFGTTRPAAMGVYDGVPVVWVYGRPALDSYQRASP